MAKSRTLTKAIRAQILDNVLTKSLQSDLDALVKEHSELSTKTMAHFHRDFHEGVSDLIKSTGLDPSGFYQADSYSLRISEPNPKYGSSNAEDHDISNQQYLVSEVSLVCVNYKNVLTIKKDLTSGNRGMRVVSSKKNEGQKFLRAYNSNNHQSDKRLFVPLNLRYNTDVHLTPEKDSEIIKEWENLIEKGRAFENELVKMGELISATLGSVKTVNKLLEVWPEAKEFLPEFTDPNSSALIPVESIKSLNSMIDSKRPLPGAEDKAEAA